MEKQSSHKRFQPRKRTKTEHSQHENTIVTRQWEYSKVGLESGLLKLDRNRRVAICRERARMKKKNEWKLLTTIEQGEREAAMIHRLTAHYEKEKNALRRAWYHENKEKSEEEIYDDEPSDEAEEMDSSDSKFETDEGEEEPISPQSKVELSNSIAGIYNQTLGNIQRVFENFEELGSYEEAEMEDGVEFKTSDEQEDDEEVPEKEYRVNKNEDELLP
jgi:hypothetical protein